MAQFWLSRVESVFGHKTDIYRKRSKGRNDLAHQVEYNPDSDIIEIKYTGEISLEGVLSAIDDAWELIQLHTCYLVLSDFLNAEISFDPSRILEINEKLAALDVPKEIRSAVVVPGDEESNRNMQVRLYELASGTGGWPAQMFYSREQALQWLRY